MFNFHSIRLLMVVAVLNLSSAISPPQYYIQCCVDDIHFNECITSTINAMFSVVNGDPSYNIPSLNPLVESKMTIIDNSNGIFQFRPARLYGFDDMVTTNNSLNIFEGVYSGFTTFSELKISGPFNIDYKIQNTTIQGSGRGSITYTNLHVSWGFKFISDPCGNPYIQDPISTLSVEEIRYRLCNLAPNEVALLNTNTKQTFEDSRERLGAQLGVVLTLPLQPLTELLSLHQLVDYNCCTHGRCLGRWNRPGICDHHGFCCDTYMEQCCKQYSGDYCLQNLRKNCRYSRCDRDSDSDSSEEDYKSSLDRNSYSDEL